MIFLFVIFQQLSTIMIRQLRRIFNFSTALQRYKYFSEFELKEMVTKPNQLRDLMLEQISEYGEMKIQDYWKQALTSDRYGYYQSKNAFSKEGDFTTAPQISSLFGQMVATWLVVLMQQEKVKVINPLTNAVEKKFRIVELGPGRGALMEDILRSFRDYKIGNHFDLSFIEISELNKKQQQKTVLNQLKKNQLYFKFDYQNATKDLEQFSSEDKFKDINLRWFSSLEEFVKKDFEDKQNGKELPFTIFVMNEFFDALPPSILEYTEVGWRQKVIKLSRVPGFNFELKNSSRAPFEKMIPKYASPKVGDTIEFSPQSLQTVDLMSKIILMCGGAIINIDYGGPGPFEDSIRAIKDHKYISAPYFWQLPGMCDLSAYVGFSALSFYAQQNQGIKAFELIPQQFFLEAMGIDTRIEIFKKTKTKSQLERIESERNRLMDPSEMGQIYKVQIISLEQYGQIYPHITTNNNVF